MPRFFFNIKDGKDLTDTEGTELAGIAEARDQALTAAGEMIKHQKDTVWNGSEWRMHVTDEAGRPVFTLRFAADDDPPRLSRPAGNSVHAAAEAACIMSGVGTLRPDLNARDGGGLDAPEPCRATAAFRGLPRKR